MSNTIQKKISSLLFTISPILLMSCGQETTKAPKEQIRPVRSQRAILSDGIEKRTFSGVAAASTVIQLSFRISGKLKDLITIKNGQKVKKGDLLASIESKNTNIKIQSALTNIKTAKIQYQNSLSNLERIKSLYEKNSIALQEYENAKNNTATKKSSLDAKQKELDLAKRELEFTKIIAPASGVISIAKKDHNENIKAGEAIFELNAGKGMNLQLGIPESFINNIKVGQKAAISFVSLKDETFEGTISEASFSMDPRSKTYATILKIDNTNEKIRPGMSGNAIFAFQSKKAEEVFLVPASSIANDSSGSYLFLVNPSQTNITTVKKQAVEVGKLTDKGFQILRGLKVGDEVVTAGLSKMSNGLKVKKINK